MSVRKVLLPALLLGSALLGGCYYSPYGYPGYGGYAGYPGYYAPPVVAPVVVGFGGYYGGRRFYR